MKKTLLIISLIMVLAASLFMTACGKSGGEESSSDEPMTLEKYAVDNPDVQKSIDEALSDSDVEIAIKGNDVIYTSELSKCGCNGKHSAFLCVYKRRNHNFKCGKRT